MVTAVPQDQWRLLDLQAHDTRLSQLAHRRRSLPQHVEIERLTERRRGIESTLVGATTARSDVQRELTKAEADVAQVVVRAERDQARLDNGQGTASDLLALQRDLASLVKRRGALEDVQLEIMERLEAADVRVAELQAQVDRVQGEIDELAKVRDAALAEIDGLEDLESRARTTVAGGVAADLLALYEKVREQNSGLGAARLYQRRCEGCRLELTPSDLQRIRAAAPDEVVRCDECRRILVRTGESGL